MEGVTGFATRLWFALVAPPQVMTTPFLRITETFPIAKINPMFVPELTTVRGTIPYKLIPQLMTPSTLDFERIAEHLLKFTDFVDLNCGCPSPTVVGGGSGSSLLNPPEKFGQFVATITQRLGPGKVSVKMRTGFDDASEFDELINQIKDRPLAQLTIHGRTRKDRYTGRADWQKIQKAAENVTFPVIGSGDVLDRQSLQAATAAAPLVKGIIIGRGALRNPWVFQTLAPSEQNTPLRIELDTVILMLGVFGSLQSLYQDNPSKLIQIAQDGHFATKLPTSPDAWQEWCERALPNGQRWDFSSQILSRIKMIWHHLRTSLPQPFFQTEALRAKDFQGFSDCIRKIATEAGMSRLEVGHKPGHDWLFSGAGKS